MNEKDLVNFQFASLESNNNHLAKGPTVFDTAVILSMSKAGWLVILRIAIKVRREGICSSERVSKKFTGFCSCLLTDFQSCGRLSTAITPAMVVATTCGGERYWPISRIWATLSSCTHMIQGKLRQFWKINAYIFVLLLKRWTIIERGFNDSGKSVEILMCKSLEEKRWIKIVTSPVMYVYLASLA